MSYRYFVPALVALSLLISGPVAAQEKTFLGALFGKKEASSTSKKTVSYSLFGGGPKRVEINLTNQQLKAYEGNRVVLKTNISSGKTGNTPTGNFKAGPYKSATHFSSRYHNAPMPWSVQITGHIFVHGSSHVPNYPASHGCVRVPLTGSNPAKKLFNWLDVGTPVKITY